MTPERRLDWENVKTVAEVARRGTVRAAAETLGIHHSTISRRIESLEEAIGTRLFDRLPTGYALTRAGETVVAAATSFSDELADAEREILGRDSILTGRIVVTMPEPIAVNIIMPHLSEFCDEYPGLEVEMLATFTPLNMAAREADVAIRISDNPPDTLIGKKLYPIYQAAYASPDYLARHDLVNAPEEARWLGWGELHQMFPEWSYGPLYSRIPVWGNFPELAVQVAGARSGLGLAILPCGVADQDPGLVRIDNSPPMPIADVWVLTHADLRHTARVKAFMEFAEKILRENKLQFSGDL